MLAIVVCYGFCSLACCYSLVLYFYKTAVSGKFSEIFLVCCIVESFPSTLPSVELFLVHIDSILKDKVLNRNFISSRPFRFIYQFSSENRKSLECMTVSSYNHVLFLFIMYSCNEGIYLGFTREKLL